MIPIHPRIVHFPVALLIIAAVFGVLALVFSSKRRQFMELLIWNLAIGVAGAIIAIITGLQEEKNLAHNDAIHNILEIHELIGYVISVISLMLLIWMILRKSKMRLPEFASIVIILVLSSGLLGYGAHLGGKMVYAEGAGVIPMEKVISGEDHNHQHEDGTADHHEKESGNDSLDNPNSGENNESHEHDHSSHEH
ncbi:MAG: hypothetical protein DRI98_14545 [Bacteroidetes bacterium]|nr:MAG: hypothetical protein DRI98_14545 [Bacteroidota bacterium]